MTSKKCTKCGEEKPLSEYHKAKLGKDGRMSWCKQCHRAWMKAWAQNHREQCRAYTDRHQAKNPDQWRARYERNKDKRDAANLEWHRNNPERSRANSRAWKQANKDKVARMAADRKAARLRRTPAWADKKLIGAIYRAAQEQGKTVDHYYPLQGKTVSGLHVPFNLQLLTTSQNSSKNNKHPGAVEPSLTDHNI